jgi:MFS transporter, putative metabolite:H+ symporter
LTFGYGTSSLLHEGVPTLSESVAARMNRLPVTRTHRLATVAVGLGLFFDIYEIFLAGTLANVLVADFHLDKAILPAVLSSTFIGMFVGAIVLGRLADRFGRMVSRFLAGIGVGALPALADTYLGDLLPPKRRGRYTGWAYALSFFGVPVVGFLAGWLVPLHPDAWRLLFVIGALGAVIVFPLRSGMPESPRWLESVGRVEEAERIVARFEAEAGGDLPAPAADEKPNTKASVKDLFVPPYRRRMGMMAVFHPLQTLGYYGFGTLVPQVLAAKGYPIVRSLVFSAITFIGYPVGAALSLPIIERVERKYLVVAASLGMAVCGLAFRFRLKSGADLNLRLPPHGRQQHLLQHPPRPPGGDLPDGAALRSRRQHLLVVPVVECRHAVRVGPAAARDQHGRAVRRGGRRDGRRGAGHRPARSAYHRPGPGIGQYLSKPLGRPIAIPDRSWERTVPVRWW